MLEKLIANKISDVKSKIVELKSEDKEFSATTLVEKVSNPSKIITVGQTTHSFIKLLDLILVFLHNNSNIAVTTKIVSNEIEV